ncbi:hypothetical protein [Glaciecola sp. 1036]|uniref:hypothetical protein n=1 Tax=Alteromonadaceae TaxID=72275 RepID=UPI003D07F562
MKKIAIVSFLVILCALSQKIDAKDIQESINKLCDKVEQCVIPEIEQSDLPPEMFKMMVDQIKTQCRSTYEWADNAFTSEIEDAAIACLDSLSALTCSEFLEDDGEVNTPECQEYEKLTQ